MKRSSHGMALVRAGGFVFALGLAACGTKGPTSSLTARASSPPPGTALTALPAVSVAPSAQLPSSNAEPTPLARPDWLVGGGAGSVESSRGVVVSVEANATRAGAHMLALGGNAVDAAVAVAFALAVTHPTAGNLGGGGFMLVKRTGENAWALDFRERAPAATNEPAFARMIARGATGPSSVGVPGTVAGLLLAHGRWGVLSREVVLGPAISLASIGHPLGERQAKTIVWAWADLERDPESRRIYGRAGRPLRAGEDFVQPDLGRTLELIRDRGKDGFYAGETATAIHDVMQRRGGLVSSSDLATYEPRVRDPLVTAYRGLTVEVMSPPSAGGVALVETLAMLERLEAWQWNDSPVDELHVFAEVARRAHADRRFTVVDPDSVDDYDSAVLVERWRRGAGWLERFPIQRSARTPSERLHNLPQVIKRESENTTHLSVADADGLVVSCTTTLSRGFGARFVVPGTGILLNNSLAAFGTTGADLPKPGRRMTSSMSPTIVSLGGTPLLVLGSPGGDTIPNTVAQVLRNVVDHHMSLALAVDAPRIHHGFVPDEIAYESARPPPAEVLDGLRSRGHGLSAARSAIGDANSIMLWQGLSWAYADPREGGLALAPESVVAGSP
jgi:gamma-glutamyltranspeptidase / glutathione hydrolase